MLFLSQFPAWGGHVFAVVRKDYSRIWGLVPTKGCQLRTAPCSYLILTFISGGKVPEARWASLLSTLFLFLPFKGLKYFIHLIRQ